MSLPVELEALRGRIAEFGETAYLVTVNEQGTPHVVSVTVRCDDDEQGLVMPIGRRTLANLEATPDLTLLWPASAGSAYAMIVDATAASLTADPAELTATAHSAVLHRVAGAAGEGPTCLPVADPEAMS